MGELQDPFLVSVHLIADPGHGKFLQHAADAVLEWVHPELQLFRVSERACVSQRPRPKSHQSCSQTANGQPALAVIVFLQEACGGKEQILMLHHALQRPPWRYHHTEEVSNGRRMLPLTPCSQDFFTLAPGTPLWAVRQVHYGKEIVRFTVYCGYKNYSDMVRLYKLLLQRRVAQKKDDFCFFVTYSNPDMEIQLSFKRLPRGQSPVTLESAVMEVRVRDVGALVPLLPNPCTPISEVRWRTEDYDGNKILLQVQAAHFNHTQDPAYVSSVNESTFTRSATSCRNRRHHRATSRSRVQRQTSLSSLPLPCEDEQEQWAERWPPDGWKAQLRGHHQSTSLYSLPNLGSASSSPGPSPSPHHRQCSLQRRTSLIPPFRLNVDALIGAEETDVDTGRTVHPGSGVDLTVVSAYIQPSLPHTPRRSPVNPEDTGLSLGKAPTQEGTFMPVGTNSLSTSSTASPQDLHSSAAPSLSDVSMNSCSVVEESCTAEEEEDEQEFYI